LWGVAWWECGYVGMYGVCDAQEIMVREAGEQFSSHQLTSRFRFREERLGTSNEGPLLTEVISQADYRASERCYLIKVITLSLAHSIHPSNMYSTVQYRQEVIFGPPFHRFARDKTTRRSHAIVTRHSIQDPKRQDAGHAT